MPPTIKRNAATFDKVFTGVASEVVLDLQSLGWDPFMFGCHVVQASVAFTVEVLGPLGVFGPYPVIDSDGTQGAGAGEVLIVRGRWERIKVILGEAGDVGVRADLVLDAYV